MNRRWIFPLCGIALLLAAAGCGEDMQEQPSFQSQEGLRRHSPEGSVPQTSRSVLLSPPASSPELVRRGASLFEVNCSHCHGKQGLGDGPAGKFLALPPFNLRADQTQQRSPDEIFEILTDGRIVMPAFKGVLSAEERWAIAYFVKSFRANQGERLS